MIVNDHAIVIGRRSSGEADRLCALYTRDHGRLTARFVGVDKPGRKMKALSEPLTCSELRLHISPRTGLVRAIGGELLTSFPALRLHLGRTLDALACCELASELTAERLPNEGKFKLLLRAFSAWEESDSPWMLAAFGLRLLELSGYGVESLGERQALCPPEVWSALHEPDWPGLGGLPFDEPAARRVRELVAAHVEAQTGRPLRLREFWSQMGVSREAVPA